MAQRRLGHAQFRRRIREAAFLSDGDKGQKVVEMAALHSSHLLISLCRF